jgi:hypothetical protein
MLRSPPFRKGKVIISFNLIKVNILNFTKTLQFIVKKEMGTYFEALEEISVLCGRNINPHSWNQYDD